MLHQSADDGSKLGLYPTKSGGPKKSKRAKSKAGTARESSSQSGRGASHSH